MPTAASNSIATGVETAAATAMRASMIAQTRPRAARPRPPLWSTGLRLVLVLVGLGVRCYAAGELQAKITRSVSLDVFPRVCQCCLLHLSETFLVAADQRKSVRSHRS